MPSTLSSDFVGGRDGLRAVPFLCLLSVKALVQGPANICRSFRADGTRIQYPGFRFALPWALVLYAFGVFAKNLVVPLNRSAFDYAKHVQPSRAIANIGPSRFAMAGSGLAPWGLELEARGLDFCILSSTLLTFFRKLGKRILVSFVQESAESQTRAR